MTNEELKEYNKLSPNEKDYYNMGMRQHPDWEHGQAIAFAKIVSMTSRDPLPKDPEPSTLRDIYLTIIKRTQDIIKNDFPRIYQQVRIFFEDAINWLKKAINVTINSIINFLS